MLELRILHNPRCSKSRSAVAIAEEAGAEAEIVKYLDTPPSREELEFIVDHLDVEPKELVRKDKRFSELGLVAADYVERDAVVEILAKHPELMERPVAILGDKVVLGRPPEKINALLGLS